MFCQRCGAHNPDTAQFCNGCGQPLTAAPPPGTPPVWGSLPNATPQGAPPVAPETSSKAIASLVLGFFAFLFPAAVAAIVLGHLSRADIRKSAGRLKGSGMAMTGLVFGYLGAAVLPLLIVSAIAIPNLLRSRIAANEASAVGSLRTLNTAQVTYATSWPGLGFACELTSLGPGAGEPNARGAGLIDSVLAGGTKSGYRFELSGCSGSPNATYFITATPQPNAGVRIFCTDESGVIRYESGYGTCSSTSPPLQ